MLNCRNITEHANDYLDKNLPLMKRLKLRLHLFMCVNCRLYLAQLQTTIATLGKMNENQDTRQESINDIVKMLKTEQQHQCGEHPAKPNKE